MFLLAERWKLGSHWNGSYKDNYTCSWKLQSEDEMTMSISPSHSFCNQTEPVFHVLSGYITLRWLTSPLDIPPHLRYDNLTPADPSGPDRQMLLSHSSCRSNYHRRYTSAPEAAFGYWDWVPLGRRNGQCGVWLEELYWRKFNQSQIQNNTTIQLLLSDVPFSHQGSVIR